MGNEENSQERKGESGLENHLEVEQLKTSQKISSRNRVTHAAKGLSLILMGAGYGAMYYFTGGPGTFTGGFVKWGVGLAKYALSPEMDWGDLGIMLCAAPFAFLGCVVAEIALPAGTVLLPSYGIRYIYEAIKSKKN